MAKRSRRIKCRYCNQLFFPDHRNVGRQRCCARPECRRTSKRVCQRRWLKRPENRDYFRGQAAVERTQRWRSCSPKYWERMKLKDSLMAQPIDSTNESRTYNEKLSALQEYCLKQHFILIGLLASFTGALQDDMDLTLERLLHLGRDVHQGGRYGEKKGPSPPESQGDPGGEL